MRYLLLVYVAETPDAFAMADQDQARSRVYASFGAKNAAIRASGLLYSTISATVLVHAGRQFLQDGPAVATSEQLSGYYVLTCCQREEALALAKQLAQRYLGAVEVRPIAENGWHSS